MNTAEILEEAISDRALRKSNSQHNLRLVLEMAQLAIPAALLAGAAGNVTCKAVASKILELQKKLK